MCSEAFSKSGFVQFSSGACRLFSVDRPMKEKENELFAAIESKDFEKATELIQSGVNINCHDASGMSLLSACAYRGSLQLVQLCIEKGANVNDKEHSQGYTPLMFGALSGRPDIC
ncbi:Ankyrin repeat protein, partial [Trichostrongylus colubriformis]